MAGKVKHHPPHCKAKTTPGGVPWQCSSVWHAAWARVGGSGWAQGGKSTTMGWPGGSSAHKAGKARQCSPPCVGLSQGGVGLYVVVVVIPWAKPGLGCGVACHRKNLQRTCPRTKGKLVSQSKVQGMAFWQVVAQNTRQANGVFLLLPQEG